MNDLTKNPVKQPRRKRGGTSLYAYGEPMVWIIGGILAFAMTMIAGLLYLVASQGGFHFLA